MRVFTVIEFLMFGALLWSFGFGMGVSFARDVLYGAGKKSSCILCGVPLDHPAVVCASCASRLPEEKAKER